MIVVQFEYMAKLIRRVENLARMTATRAEQWSVSLSGDTATAVGENGALVLISRPQSTGDAPALPCPADLLDKQGLTWAPRRQYAYDAAYAGAVRALDILLVKDAIDLAKAKEREVRRSRGKGDAA